MSSISRGKNGAQSIIKESWWIRLGDLMFLLAVASTSTFSRVTKLDFSSKGLLLPPTLLLYNTNPQMTPSNFCMEWEILFQLWQGCQNDIQLWFKDFMVIYNPHSSPCAVPWLTFPVTFLCLILFSVWNYLASASSWSRCSWCLFFGVVGRGRKHHEFKIFLLFRQWTKHLLTLFE